MDLVAYSSPVERGQALLILGVVKNLCAWLFSYKYTSLLVIE
jgi:hypothetical protein